MIGRGTRLCPGLLDGEDKSLFYIFDFCGNFDFFRMRKGQEVGTQLAIQGALFCLKFELAYKLQELSYQTKELQAFRQNLIEQMAAKVRGLNRENFAVRQHLRYVDLYANKENYQLLTYEDTLTVKEELAPLLEPEQDEASALRLMPCCMALNWRSWLAIHTVAHARTSRKKVAALATVANIPDIQREGELINKILHTGYLDEAKVHDLEHIRQSLRSLMKYVPRRQIRYDTDFSDEILNIKENHLNWKMMT